MKKYSVGIKKICVAYVEVEAKNRKEARDLAKDIAPKREYFRTMHKKEWYVHKISNEDTNKTTCPHCGQRYTNGLVYDEGKWDCDKCGKEPFVVVDED